MRVETVSYQEERGLTFGLNQLVLGMVWGLTCFTLYRGEFHLGVPHELPDLDGVVEGRLRRSPGSGHEGGHILPN